MALDLSTEDYFKIVMSSGAVAALVTTAINAFITSRQKRAEAIPTLIDTANMLDSYAVKCAQLIGASYLAQRECWDMQSFDPVYKFELPAHEFASDTPWAFMNKGMVSALKAFPPMVQASMDTLSEEKSNGNFPPDALPLARDELVKLGLYALDLSERLRARNGLPLEPHHLAENSTTKRLILEEQQRGLKRRALVDASNEELMRELNSLLPVTDMLSGNTETAGAKSPRA